MHIASFISFLLHLFSLSFPDISFPIFSNFCFSQRETTDRVKILALTGNPYIEITLQLIGKNNIERTGERTGPMDSYTNHPWVKEVLLSNLLRSEGETQETRKLS
jgi:hypothetical protein